MGAITLAKANIDCLKRAVRQRYPEVKSSHLSEAIAFALGFRTHAALLTAIDRETSDLSVRVWLDGNLLAERLHQLSYNNVSARDLFAILGGVILFPLI